MCYDCPSKAGSTGSAASWLAGAGQWPVGGIFEALSASRLFFIFFAARFSFNVWPCFLALAFRGDLSDTMAPLLAQPVGATVGARSAG
jgi:hypothetical protein